MNLNTVTSYISRISHVNPVFSTLSIKQQLMSREKPQKHTFMVERNQEHISKPLFPWQQAFGALSHLLSWGHAHTQNQYAT